jgi:hypothetical protein
MEDQLDKSLLQKALWLHLYLPKYPIEKLEAEEQRIEENHFL